MRSQETIGVGTSALTSHTSPLDDLQVLETRDDLLSHSMQKMCSEPRQYSILGHEQPQTSLHSRERQSHLVLDAFFDGQRILLELFQVVFALVELDGDAASGSAG